VKLNSTSHFNRTAQKVVNNPEIHGSSHVAENVEKNTPVQSFTPYDVNEDVKVGPVILKGGTPSVTLTLHNAFDALDNADCELHAGEVLHSDMDQVTSSMDTQVDIIEPQQEHTMNNTSQIEAPMLDNFVSTEMASHSSVKDRPSKDVDPVTLLHWANTPVLTPLALHRGSVPSHLSHEKSLHQIPVEPGDCAHIAAIDDSVKANLDNNTFHPPMPQPVTIRYDSLTCDKVPSNQHLVPASKPSLHSAAVLKSV